MKKRNKKEAAKSTVFLLFCLLAQKSFSRCPIANQYRLFLTNRMTIFCPALPDK